jgi:hypothetical protein
MVLEYVNSDGSLGHGLLDGVGGVFLGVFLKV